MTESTAEVERTPANAPAFRRVLLKLSGEDLMGELSYGTDPALDDAAEFIPEITHKDALTRGLQVMDSTAFALCMDNKLPIIVFNMADRRNLDKIVSGERVGTLVRT